MYDATTWSEVRTPSQLAAVDEEAHPDGVCLLVDPSTSPEDLAALPGSEHLSRVAVLALDGDVRAAADAILRSPHLTRVHTIVLGDVWWGEYSANASPYGWQEHALSKALDALFERAPFARVVCRGSLPSMSDDEYGGTLGFVLISTWWKGLTGLELDTPSLGDGFLRAIDEFAPLRSLRVASPLLTDASAELLSHKGSSCFEGMEEFEFEGHLVSNMGWEWLFDASWLPEHLSDAFDELACAPSKTWEQRFGDVRSLTQGPMNMTVFHVVLDQLGKLRGEDLERYDTEILPHLEAMERARWPHRVEFVFGSSRDIGRMEAASVLVPFLMFDVCTADPSWSVAKWEYLYESDVAGVVRRIESFNHDITLADGDAFHDCEALSRIEEIDFSNQHAFPVEALTAWLSSPYLENLEMLDLSLESSMSGSEVLQTLCASEHLGSLRHLTLSASSIDDAAVDALAQAPLLSRLEHLELAHLTGTQRALLLGSEGLSDAARARLS